MICPPARIAARHSEPGPVPGLGDRGLDDRQLSQLPGVLVGSPGEIADRLHRYREEYGTSYISVLEPHMAAFAKVIKHLR